MSPDQELLPSAEERMRALPDPPIRAVEEVRRWNRQMSIFLVVSAVALAVAIIVAVFSIGSWGESTDRADRNAQAAANADARASAAGDQASAAAAAAKEANRRLAALGKPTVPIPTVTISEPPVFIPDGLTAQQTLAVRGIIADELVRAHPDLTPAQVQQISRVAASLVVKPKDGKTPTAAELTPLAQAAQRAYCVDGRCEGKTGTQGPVGPAGKDAPAVTDEQLRSTVDAYCAQDARPCAGVDGRDGQRGPAGRSVTDTDCVGDGEESYWQVSYDQAPFTEKRMGPCRVGPAPTLAVRTR